MSHLINLSNAAVKLTGMPVSLPLASYTVHGIATYTKNGRAIAARELRVNSGARTKRCFVLIPPLLVMARPMLGVAWPGSNSGGGGAADLLAGNSLNQQEWPLQLVADHNIFMVAIDLPLFGPMPAYSSQPTEPLGPIIDDVSSIQAARHYIETVVLPSSTARFRSLRREMFCGGLSWGASRTAFMMASCTDMAFAYVGSTCTSKEHDPRPAFNPPEWASNYDYDDLAVIASSWCKIRWQFGGDGLSGHAADYLYAPFTTGNPADATKLYTPSGGPNRTVPNAARMLADMETNGNGITTIINQSLTHEIDVPDLKQWFKPFLPNSLKRWSFAAQ